MTTEKLETNYYIFGNKGNVWNDQCHIAKAGDFNGRTLCGVPMLSSNWAKIEKISHIGCESCNKIYNESKS